MNATTPRPRLADVIRPDDLYGIDDFVRWFPTTSGRRLSIDVARRWAAQSRYGLFNRAAGEGRVEYAIRGRDLLAVVRRKWPVVVVPARNGTDIEKTPQMATEGGGA